MSMPAKGKHHLSHHHHQQHHPHQQQQQQQQQQPHHPQQQPQPQQQQQPSHQHPQQQQHVNVNQPGVTNTPQAYNAVVAANTARYVTHAGSEFHVPGQNYVAQPGGHVGGGGGSVGVPGGRGPPSLGGIQSIGQTTAGIQPGGPPSGQQQPPQAQTPGVQQQQSQGPAPTTTPPVHTPSPQEMGKQAHLQSQPPLQQVYVPNQTRPVSQAYFPSGPRPQQPRGLGHRGGQGGAGSQVVGMPGVGGGSSQPTAMYSHQSISVPQGTAMYAVQSQVQPLHAGSHQPMYPFVPMFHAQPQRHQGQQGQAFYPSYAALHVPPQNLYPFQAQGAQHQYYSYPPPATPLNLSRASANAVSGGAQHVGGPLAGAQGAGGVPQGQLQQPSQQPQPIPPMSISLAPAEVYTGHNGGTSNASSTRPPKTIRKFAITDIVNPETGDNISCDIYGSTAAAVSTTSSNRETPQPPNPEVAADFAARVAKRASEPSETISPVPQSAAVSAAGVAAPVAAAVVPSNAPEHAASSTGSSGPSATSLKIQTNSSKDSSSQCNTGPPTPTQNAAILAPAVGSQPPQPQPPPQQQQQQTLNSSSSIAPAISQVDSCPVPKPESKPLQFVDQEFRPRGEIKPVSSPVVIAAEEQHHVAAVAAPPVAAVAAATAALVSKGNIPVAQPDPVATSPVVVASSIVVPPTLEKQPEVPKSVAAVAAAAPVVPAPAPSVPLAAASTIPGPVANAPASVPEPRSHPSNTAAQATAAAANVAPVGIQVPAFPGPLPSRPRPMYTASPMEPFPSLASNSSSSPPRRKPNQHHQQQQQQQQVQAPAPTAASTVAPAAVAAAELPPSGKDQHKERKISDRSTGASRGTTPTPSHNQTEQHQRSNGETASEKSDSASESAHKADHHHPKSGDGKAMQNKKSKSKSKNKDLNRRGAEKEGTDMDAFVNPAAASKQEAKTQQQAQQDNKGQTAQAQPPSKDSNVAETCPARESAKGIKERENNETKVECSEPEVAKAQKGKNLSKSEVSKEASAALPPVCPVAPAKEPIVDDVPQQQAAPAIQQNHKESASKESTPTIEDGGKSSQGVCNMPTKTLANDVVDHAKVIVKDEIDVEAIVAQKNEENAKVSALHASSNEKKTSSDEPVVEKESESETPAESDAPKGPPPLKYTYKDDQWSPRNVTGKKEYDREFLMRLQDDPKSRVRPQHLPEMDVVLKECNKTSRGASDIRPFKEPNPDRHNALFPGFAKTNYINASARLQQLPLVNKKSNQGRAKGPMKPNVIHLSLSEDVKLRETENAWRPARLKSQTTAEEVAATDQLYKKVRSVLNKLTPQKFDTLVSQVRALEIDTQEKLQGVIDLVFEKAVDEPNFSVAYALMCKELAMIKVLTDEAKKAQKNNEGQENSESQAPSKPPAEVNFRKLIIERCQMQFQKNTDDEAAKVIKLKEIAECTDPEKKKELEASLEEDERRLRVRSVGNIRFIGELFKKGILTTKIMNFCISHLLSKPDEENLECLCKLLTTIGKVLEEKIDSKSDSLGSCFSQLTELAGKKNQRKISSRIRFMIQDVIDLRSQDWVPRRDEYKPKTMDQIQKEAEADVQLNNTPMNTPRKDDRNNDRRRRDRGGGNSGMEEGGWSQPVGKTRQQPYSVETSKLSLKITPPDELRLGSRSQYAWGAQTATSKTLTPNKYAILDSDLDKRQPLQVSGSRSTGPRDYGRSDYKSPWENKGSRMSSHQMNSGVSSREALMEGGRSQSLSMPPPQMKMKPQPTSTVPTGSTSSLSSSTSNKPSKTVDELTRMVASMIDGAPCEPNTELFIKNAMEQIQDDFDSSSYELFVRESINGVLERSAAVRNQFSALFSHLVNHNILPLSLIQSELEKVLVIGDDLVIDIPKVWTYLAELLVNMVVTNAHPLAEFKTTAAVLKKNGSGGKLMGELLAKLVRDQGPKWVKEKWDQSGLQWSDLIDTQLENLDDIIKKYKLEFLSGEGKSSDIASSGSQLTNEQIHDHLVKLMRESNFDNICSWILANVGSRVTDPQFIRILMTAILDVTVEERHKVWKLNENSFKNLQTLIKRFIADANADLELQCLFAIQAYVHRLEHPHGLLFSILTSLHQNDILSDDAFLTWESHTGEFPGHAVAIKGLTSFFTGLREPDSDDA